jgi:DNA-binding NtrC family response regulator
MTQTPLPRILIIDDLFGRTLPDRRNEERASLCGQYLFADVSGDESGKGEPQRVMQPVAEAVFYRGQRPLTSKIGDTVENDIEGVLQAVQRGWQQTLPEQPRWAMVLLDLCFYTGSVTPESHRRTPGMPEGRVGDDDPEQYFGLQILSALREKFPELPVIILSSKSRKEVSRDIAYLGALAFMARDDANSPELLKEYLFSHGLVQDASGLVVGRSTGLMGALRAARRAAATRRNLLIRGERGTGKELLARYVHRNTVGGSESPFVVVNSAVLTPELFASELFGIERGVATGVEQRVGLIPAATGGDLFLDEIGDMPTQVQAGILRSLEDRHFTPVGARSQQSVNVRFLSATNSDLDNLVGSGAFRHDLLDRLLEGGSILLPPLRERKEDLPLLVENFLRNAEAAHPRAMRRTVDPEALDALMIYEWPGNIRELRNRIFNAVANYPDVEHLVPLHLQLPASPLTFA